MYYVEFVWITKDGKTHSYMCTPDEEADQRAYITEGLRAGWITDYSHEVIKETW